MEVIEKICQGCVNGCKITISGSNLVNVNKQHYLVKYPACCQTLRYQVVNKVCKISNLLGYWLLEVDKKRFPFVGSDNALYFKEHYESLGYTVDYQPKFYEGD